MGAAQEGRQTGQFPVYKTGFTGKLVVFVSVDFFSQANLRQKVTHSVQTELSHYKRDNDTQVYLPRCVCERERER